MSDYFCHACAIKLGYVNPISTPTPNLTGTNYQLAKFLKHTAPTGVHSINSVFDNPAYSAYQNHVISGQLSGCVEMDNNNRKNVIWYAGEQVGITYSGSFNFPVSGVKIVLEGDQTKVHAFPVAHPQSMHCKNCGCLIPF